MEHKLLFRQFRRCVGPACDVKGKDRVANEFGGQLAEGVAEGGSVTRAAQALLVDERENTDGKGGVGFYDLDEGRSR